MILQVRDKDGRVRLSINNSYKNLARQIKALGIGQVPFEQVFHSEREIPLAGRTFTVRPGDTVSLI